MEYYMCDWIRDEDGDVSFMECEIPEVIVFLKESDYQAFKDICLPRDKCSVKNCELDHNYISNMLKYELANSSSKETSEEVLLYISTKADSSPKNDRIKDVKLSRARNKLMEDNADSDASDEIDDAHSQDNGFSCSEPLNSNELIDGPGYNQDPSTESIMAEFLKPKNEVYSDDKNTTINKGTGRIRHNSDSLLTAILREKSEEIGQRFKDEKMRNNTDCVSRNSVAVLSRQSTSGLPEYENSIFSALGPPSGRFTFSGSIPYSDTISLHSNSTTSTRSFAFPILETEWNESPVRMAEADRRRLKKHSCWRMCFTCCSF